jgi:hypothetical protein
LDLLAAFFEFFHALLQARISVDQSFSSITHEPPIITQINSPGPQMTHLQGRR